MTYYLKNTSGSTVNVIDLGISLPDSQSLVIDSNGINAYLSSDLTSALIAESLILSTTDIGDNGGDLSSADAVAALSITSRYDRDNPHSVTITQTLSADSNASVTLSELNELVAGSNTDLHTHDDRYFTETELATSGEAEVHWDNITNAPSFGSLEWQEPALGNLIGKGTTAEMPLSADEGQFYLNTDDNHLYKYISGSWVDQGAPETGTRVIFKDGTNSDDRIYEWDGDSWDSDPAPEDNWAIVISDDGDGNAAQYVYSSSSGDWIKIADVDWGSHNALSDRDATDSHPATAISFDNSGTTLSSTDVQNAIAEIATEQGVDLDNIVFVAKNGIDVNSNVELGTIANPYLTIQAAIDSISGASSTNRYLVYVMPGDYDENVVLSKLFVYLAAPSKLSTRITSSNGNTLTISTTTEKSSGIYNISLVSNSSTTTDNALYITGNNPILFNVDVLSPSGARTAYVNGSYSQTFRHVNLKTGEFRIDAGVVEFYDSKVIETITNITSGTLRIHNGDFSHNGGDAIYQTGGTVYLVSANLSSGSGSYDYNQSGGTVYWGWVEYDESKVVFNGTKTLIFDSQDLYYNSTGDTNITGSDIDTIIGQLDVIITNILSSASNHEGDTSNPHSVTFTQAVDADPNTDITTTEVETLTDGSNADSLHIHAANAITYSNTSSSLVSVNVQAAIDEIKGYIDKKVSSLIYVDSSRTDTYTATGSQTFPYKTIAAATAVAHNGDLIYVSEGSYTEDVVLLEGAGLVGAGTSKTYITGSFTTTNKARITLGDISLYGNLTITSRALLFDLYCNGQVSINGASDANEIESRNFTIASSSGVPLTIGNNVLSVKLLSGLITASDGSSCISASSGIIVLDDYYTQITTVASTNPAIVLSGSVIYYMYQGLIQTTGGNAITSTSTNTLPHIVSDVQYAGGEMNFGSSLAIVEGVHDLTGTYKVPSGSNLIKRPGEQIAYSNTSSGLSATNVQAAIDEISNQIVEFDMPSGTVFPTSDIEAGDIFYRTDLNMTFQYDASRSKWLSMTQMFLDWGSNVADGKYLNIHGAVATQTGYLMPYNGTIISITAKIASGNQSKTIEIRRNNDRVSPLDNFTLTSGSYSSTTKNIDFEAGDYLQAFVPSSGVPAKDIVVMVVVTWRDQ